MEKKYVLNRYWEKNNDNNNNEKTELYTVR